MEIQELIQILRKRNEPVPKPSRLPTIEEVAGAESDLSIVFPPDYRRFLLEASDVVYGFREPGRVLPDLQPYICLRHIANSGWEAGIPTNHFAFCSDNGNYFTLGEDGFLGFFDIDDATHTSTKASFSDWIEEEWLEL